MFTASGKVDTANPAASVTIKGNVAGEALAGEAVLKTANGERRIDGLSLTLGPNTISGNLKLDDAFVPEGDSALALPKIGPLAALALDKAEGAINGTVSFSKADGVPQVAVNAKAASLVRGDLSVKDAEINALIVNYLAEPVVSGRVKAFSFISGTTSITDVDLSLTRDGAWTGFSGGATVNDIEARASGRLNDRGRRHDRRARLRVGEDARHHRHARRPTTVVVKDGAATLDRLTLGVDDGTVQVTGTAGQTLNLDVQIGALPATVVNAFASGLGATGQISGSARISGAAEKPEHRLHARLEGSDDGPDARRRLRRDEPHLERNLRGGRAEIHSQCRRRLGPRLEGRRLGRDRGWARTLARLLWPGAVRLPDQPACGAGPGAFGRLKCQPRRTRLDR